MYTNIKYKIFEIWPSINSIIKYYSGLKYDNDLYSKTIGNWYIKNYWNAQIYMKNDVFLIHKIIW